MERDTVCRRSVLRSGVLLFGGLAGCQGVSGPDPLPGSEWLYRRRSSADDQSLADVELCGELLADEFYAPVSASAPQSGQVFVVDQPGQIYLVDDSGRRDQPFLDISDQVVTNSTEQGLLGLAFHPEFSDNGRFFVRYSAPTRPGTPEEYAHTFVLSEFYADPGTASAAPDSETTILEIPQPQANHNAGAIAFGPDEYLYICTGDGGGTGDTGMDHVDDWYDELPGGNGQDVTENLLGAVLRIDVDTDDEAQAYTVPTDNPLVDDEGLDEYYAWGFRNPWRLSFGPAGRLFVADVGQDAAEAVYIVERGGNYGWNVREGSNCFDAESCPDETPDGDPLLPPVIEYTHETRGTTGVAVIGGYLYGGDRMDELRGSYVFADWRANGELFVARESGDESWPMTTIPVENIGHTVLSFGRDGDGELLVCSIQNAADDPTGALHRLRPA